MPQQLPERREELEALLTELELQRRRTLADETASIRDEAGDPADQAESIVEREIAEAVIDLVEGRIRLVRERLAELDQAGILEA